MKFGSKPLKRGIVNIFQKYFLEVFLYTGGVVGENFSLIASLLKNEFQIQKTEGRSKRGVYRRYPFYGQVGDGKNEKKNFLKYP